MLSVPYALHAKTAENFVENDSSKQIVVLTGDISDSEAAQKISKEVGRNTRYIHVFRTTQLTTISFDGVTELLGVKIMFNPSLTSVDFNDLVLVGEFVVERNESLTTLNLESLIYTQGINVYYTNLTSIELPLLVSTIQNLNIGENPQLTSITVNNLQNMGGGFGIYDNPLLTTLSCSSLRGVSYFDCGQNNPSLTSLDLGDFSSQIQHVVFRRCALSSETINWILAQLVSISPAITEAYIELQQQTPSAPPTGQGLIDKATLISNGNNVNTD